MILNRNSTIVSILSFLLTLSLCMYHKQEAYDSRTFGPVSTADIVGRAIYCLRTAVDHGPVRNRLVKKSLSLSLLISFFDEILLLKL